jgi:serine/threonine-protein kinase
MTTARLGKLTPERWRRIQEVLDAFDDLSTAEKPDLLAAIGEEDPELRRQVEALIENDDRLEVLEKPVFPICTEGLDGGLLVPRIGPYKLVRELGAGGMGTVFLAIQEEPFERRVALKLIQPRIDSRDSTRRFQEERQILARIRHPNVAQLYDGGTTPDGRPYFVMEYVEGVPIHEYCDAHHLSVRERLELMLQVCSAVHLAHQKLRVVHRDLKPSNILVTEDGVPKLLDFGIAKALDGAPRPGSEKQLASVWVPHYSSPEQLAGLPLTTASDIYSLGVLLYRLLTGRLPYRSDGAGPESVRRAIREQQLEKPSTAVLSSDSRIEGGQPSGLTPEEIGQARGTRPGKLNRQLAGDVDAIVLKALAVDPEDRYASVDWLSSDIRRHLNHLPIKARKNSFGYVAGKLVRRHRFVLAAAAAILLILGVSGWTVWNERAKTDQARIRAERIVELLDSLIAFYDPDATELRVTPVEFLDLARQEISDDLRNDPELLAELLSGSLAEVYRQLGQLEETESAYREALVILRTLHPDGHLKTAEVLNNLGAAHFRMRDYPEAERYYRQALEMRQRLGVPEIKLVGSLSNLAGIATTNRNFDAAEDSYRKAIEILEREPIGEAGQKLAMNYRNLGMSYFLQNRLSEAELLMRRALELESAAPKPEVTRAAEYRSALAMVLHVRGNLEEAESQLAEIPEVQRLRLGSQHEDLGRSQRNLAAVLLDRGELATAAVLLDHAQGSLRPGRPPEGWEIAELDSLIGALLTGQEDFEAAEPCLLDGYRTLKETKGAEVIQTRLALERLVRLYEVWGKPEKAAEYRALLERSGE